MVASLAKKWTNLFFTDPGIGEIFRKHFISTKLQMNQTSLQLQLKLAKYFENNFEITSYPTYLFFDANGKVVHKFVGAVDTAGFIMEAKNAMNPDAQFYTMIENFKSGKLDGTKLKDIAMKLKFARKQELANFAAVQYFVRLPKADRWNDQNILSVWSYFPQSLELQKHVAEYIKELPSNKYTKKPIGF